MITILTPSPSISTLTPAATPAARELQRLPLSTRLSACVCAVCAALVTMAAATASAMEPAAAQPTAAQVIAEAAVAPAASL